MKLTVGSYTYLLTMKLSKENLTSAVYLFMYTVFNFALLYLKNKQ